MEKGIRVRIKHLSFAYGKGEQKLFDGVSVDFAAGKLHFICGKNGSGKSTFFNILLGCVPKGSQISGELYANDEKHVVRGAQSYDYRIARNIKLVEQKFDRMIAHEFSFDENLQLACLPTYPTLSPLPIADTLDDLLREFHIPRTKPARQLSGGQRQILAIAMVLQKPTKVLLLDEPTAALDEKNAQMVLSFLERLVERTGLTALIISHDRELVTTYADNCYFELANAKMLERPIA